MKFDIEQIIIVPLTWIIVMTTIIVAAFGCATKQPIRQAIPDTPEVRYQRGLLGAADAAYLVSETLVAARDTAEHLYAAGAVDQETFTSIKRWLASIATANDRAINAIVVARSGSDSQDYQSAILQVVKTAGATDPATFNIRNPESRATFRIVTLQLSTILGVIQASFQNRRPS